MKQGAVQMFSSYEADVGSSLECVNVHTYVVYIHGKRISVVQMSDLITSGDVCLVF